MARSIHYEDLGFGIEPDQSGGYRVRLLGSPFGIATEPFPLAFGREELEAMIREVDEGLLGGPGAGGSSPTRHLLLNPEHSPGADLQNVGARLFRALFSGKAREIYLLSRGRADSLLDRGLRLRIVLPADTDDAALLQSLPWELLYDEQTDDFLARNVLTPVVRQLALLGVPAVLPETAAPRLRILIVVASPSGATVLNDADERARILEAWCRRQGAEVKVLLAATWRDLAEAVRSDYYQVVHFIVHGSFDRDNGVGSLLLETPEGKPHPISGSLLAETLRANRELRLVFLSSCETAQVGHRPDQDSLLGVAAALVRRGVPAVIAMQFQILDTTARSFSEAVYRSLARGSSLEAAVAEGRLFVFHEAPDSWEWITPTLLTALSDAQVFRPLCSPEERPTALKEEAVAAGAIDAPRKTRPLRVFLCHSSDDKPAVRNLYRRLREDGFQPWLDEQNILPGQDWKHEIQKGVRFSDVVIVCLSCSATTKRGYVQKEIRLALDAAEEQPEGSVFVVPVRLEECQVPDRLSRWQWVNLYEDDGYPRLLRALNSV